MSMNLSTELEHEPQLRALALDFLFGYARKEARKEAWHLKLS